MITSLDAENAFDKVQHPFIGTWGNLGKQGTYFNITKVGRKSKANVWLSEKKEKDLTKQNKIFQSTYTNQEKRHVCLLTFRVEDSA